MAGRKAGFQHSEKTRQKIKTSQIINRSQKFVLGEKESSDAFGEWWKSIELEMPKNMSDLKKLCGDAFGAGTAISGDLKPIEMKPAQVNAAKMLIDKTMPTLSMSDVLNSSQGEQTPEEMIQRLSDLIGKDMVEKLFPDFKSH